MLDAGSGTGALTIGLAQFAKRVDLVALQLAEEETWVLGTGGGAVAGAISSLKVAEPTRRLYLEDYRRRAGVTETSSAPWPFRIARRRCRSPCDSTRTSTRSSRRDTTLPHGRPPLATPRSATSQ